MGLAAMIKKLKGIKLCFKITPSLFQALGSCGRAKTREQVRERTRIG